MQDYFNELNKRLNKINGINEFNLLKKEMLKKYRLKQQPSNIQTLTNIDASLYKKLKFLQTKPTRTISGVAPIAIMTKPHRCVHGKCIYCPGGVDSVFGSVPQSYTGHEPASMRAKRNFYDAYLQVFNRLEQYALLNQNFDKIELIAMGGTFLSMPLRYQGNFIACSFKAMNDFSDMFFRKKEFDFKTFKNFFELPADVHDPARVKRLQEKILQLKGKPDLKREHMKNETSNVRCVTLALETRPDFCGKKHISNALSYGATRIELGVQSLNDKILKKANRGHGTKDAARATQLLRDSFFKVGFHMMPGLPGSTVESDIDMFEELFSNQDFKPDALKIYPCMVMPGTKLYELYKNGRFRPLTTDDATKVISIAKQHIPRYCRVMRIQRDIPTKFTAAGVSLTNFRQHLDSEMKKTGISCKCIRCREPKDKRISWGHVKILKSEYIASNGTEVFISAEDTKNDIILGFARLRMPYKPFRKEITMNSAGIRELHVYGASVQIGKTEENIQHHGYGTRLMDEAERAARDDFRAKKLLVISGIGAKQYFYKLGYKKDGVYLSKRL